MKERIAIATKDKVVITEHFGHCGLYHIVEIKENTYHFVGQRNVSPPCVGFEHKREGILTVLNELRDCSCIVVSQIGLGALLIAKEYGVEIIEYLGLVEEVMKIDRFHKTT